MIHETPIPNRCSVKITRECSLVAVMTTTARRDWHAAVNAFVILVLLGTFGEAFVVQSVAPSSSSSSRSTSERHRSSSRYHDPTGASSPNRGSTSSTGRSSSVSFLRAAEGEVGDRALPSLTKHHAPPAVSTRAVSPLPEQSLCRQCGVSTRWTQEYVPVV